MTGALGYLMISGAAFATVRSYIMISIMFLAVMLDRPALALRNVALAALAILWCGRRACSIRASRCRLPPCVAWCRPTSGCAGATRRARDGRCRGALRDAGLFFGGIVTSTLVASLAVAPFGIYHFHNTQQFAILANLLRHSDLQPGGDAGGAGDAGRHAARPGGGRRCG